MNENPLKIPSQGTYAPADFKTVEEIPRNNLIGDILTVLTASEKTVDLVSINTFF